MAKPWSHFRPAVACKANRQGYKFKKLEHLFFCLFVKYEHSKLLWKSVLFLFCFFRRGKKWKPSRRSDVNQQKY